MVVLMIAVTWNDIMRALLIRNKETKRKSMDLSQASLPSM